MEGEMALFIPIIGTIGFFTVIALIVFWSLKVNERKIKFEHEQRMLALDKGVDIPLTPAREKNPFIWPFIWIGIGLAFMIALAVTGESDWPFGLIPFLIGAGMLAARILFKKQKKENENQKELPEVLPVKGESDV